MPSGRDRSFCAQTEIEMKRVILVLLVLSLPAWAVKRLPRKRHHHKHKPTWVDYRAFPPTADSLLQQNAVIDEMRLSRIVDKKQLVSMVREDELVSITENKYVRINPKLEKDRRFCRPWVNAFLQELGQDYYAEFGSAIQVNSAVRTVRTQIRLLRWNHNAAPVHGEKASAHLAGVAIDLRRRGLTRAQVHFLQKRLLYFAGLNMVIVEEELTNGGCFHIVVTGDYPYPPKIQIPMQPLPELFNDNR